MKNRLTLRGSSRKELVNTKGSYHSSVLIVVGLKIFPQNVPIKRRIVMIKNLTIPNNIRRKNLEGRRNSSRTRRIFIPKMTISPQK